ncbi:MAG: rod shape-determining protein MreD [Prevotella sp.]|nr:rod shape-determining protein MreD [Prevotella sp.]
MAIDTLTRALIFLLLCLTQALVMNRIQLFNCATPLLYVYFVIMFPRNYPKWATLLWSFFMGLTIDMFANTPGVACASLTLLGAVQPYLLELFIPRDAEENMASAARTLGWGKFFTFTAILVLIYCLVFFSLEAFNFFNWLHWLECIGGSAVLTIALVMTLESIRK